MNWIISHFHFILGFVCGYIIINFFIMTKTIKGIRKLLIKIAEKQGISKEEIEKEVGKYGEE